MHENLNEERYVDKNINSFKFALYCLSHFKWRFIFMTLFFLAASVDNTVLPYIIKTIVDKLELFSNEKERAWNETWPLLMIMFFLLITTDICYRMKGLIWGLTIPEFRSFVRVHMLDHIQKYSLSFFGERKVGEIANRINDMPQAIERIMESVIEIIIPLIVTIFISFFILVKQSLLFASCFTVWLILHTLATFYFSKKCAELSKIHAGNLSMLTGIIVDSIRNMQKVKLFLRTKEEMEFINKYQIKEQKSATKMIFYNEILKMSLRFLSIIELIIIMLIAINSWKNNTISLGDVIFIFNVVSNISAMVWSLSLETPYIFEQIGVCKQAIQILQYENIIDENKKNFSPLKVTDGAIEFSKVKFGYGNHKEYEIFDELSVYIKPKQKVGLVGFSGSGKSTFLALLTRNVYPSSGKILIDNQDIYSHSYKSLIENITFLPQSSTLFNRTIAENVMYASSNSTYEEMVEAAKKANCHEFITKIPKQYNTIVGENGAKLSGGQHQLISLACAFIRNTPIIILDEATSALDYITEQYVQLSISKLIENKTAIVVAHRLSTIVKMDRILVFDNGSIVGDGNHIELLKNNKHYQKLWKAQVDGFIT